MSYLFVFRAYPDIDHMAPLAWRLLEDGEEVHAVVEPGYRVEGDYRLSLLSGYEQFHLYETAPPGGGRLRALWRTSLPWATLLLLRTHARLVAVEWGYGFRPCNRVVGFARGLVRSALRGRERQQVRGNVMAGARLLGRRVVCLPHGLNIKLPVEPRPGEPADVWSRTFDWSDRSRVDAYVLNTEQHRSWFLERAGGDPEVMQTWGSLRWDPRWFELNRLLAPRYEWPPDGEGRVKVVFMAPKWHNRVDPDAVLDLVRRLQEMQEVSLAVKGHPRPEDGSADPLRDDPVLDWAGIHDVSALDSVSVIAAADVVIDVGSSIGIETVMQDRVLLNPTYVHGLVTYFDEIEGSCVVARTPEQVLAYLREHAAGHPHRVPEEARAELLRRAVYGSRPGPFDVIGVYARRVRDLAEHGTRGN
jgi:hypothetical protein